jgi:phosphatidylglycerol:prolipoprotein diacylglycerol transferase
MIDPVIFTIGNFSLRWYGVIVMIGVIVGSLLVEREIKRRGENGDRIWDALIWVLPIGILGARLWYVLNATLGGSRYYIENPLQIINIPQGGLHIYGGLLLGAITLLWYLKKNQLDSWLFLDVAGPALLIGQAIGRIANFINQELYGPPTGLPWGIMIEASHRLPEFQDLNLFPVETTRFHPTFAYEMLWNLSAAGFLLWLSRRYEKEIKPGTLFAGWLILAGIGRIWIEFFRPDQPKIDALGISYTTIAAAIMAVVGIILLMARYKAINLAFAEDWEEEYQIAGQVKKQDEPVEKEAQMAGTEEPQAEPIEEEDQIAEPEEPQDEPVEEDTQITELENPQDEPTEEEAQIIEPENPQVEPAEEVYLILEPESSQDDPAEELAQMAEPEEPVEEDAQIIEPEEPQDEPAEEVNLKLEPENPQDEPDEEEVQVVEPEALVEEEALMAEPEEPQDEPAEEVNLILEPENPQDESVEEEDQILKLEKPQAEPDELKQASSASKVSKAEVETETVKGSPAHKKASETAKKTSSKTAKKPAARKKSSKAKTKTATVKKAPARKTTGTKTKKTTSKKAKKPTSESNTS